MTVYVDLVIALNFLVDFFLILGTNRLAGYPPGAGRAALAASLGGIYGGACMIPGFRFLGNTLWRMVSLGLMGAIAFGVDRGTLRRSVLFVLLSMALGGIALGMGTGDLLSLAGAAAGVALICAVGFRRDGAAGRYIPVELTVEGRAIRFLALRDTGNTLRDPLTGEAAMVVGGSIPEELTGLKAEELTDPIACMGKRPGLRLLPYRAVGVDHGMLLAMRVPKARIGKRQRSVLVALAPKGLGMTGEFEALIGGDV